MPVPSNTLEQQLLASLTMKQLLSLAFLLLVFALLLEHGGTPARSRLLIREPLRSLRQSTDTIMGYNNGGCLTCRGFIPVNFVLLCRWLQPPGQTSPTAP